MSGNSRLAIPTVKMRISKRSHLAQRTSLEFALPHEVRGKQLDSKRAAKPPENANRSATMPAGRVPNRDINRVAFPRVFVIFEVTIRPDGSCLAVGARSRSLHTSQGSERAFFV